MNLIEVKGWEESYLVIEIQGGDNSNNIGDQVWINPSGTELHIYESIEEDALNQLLELFDRPQRKALLGMLRKGGIKTILYQNKINTQ